MSQGYEISAVTSLYFDKVQAEEFYEVICFATSPEVILIWWHAGYCYHTVNKVHYMTSSRTSNKSHGSAVTIAPPFITLYYPTSPFIVLHHPITLHYPSLPFITLHYLSLPFITLHYPSSPFITLHHPITRHYPSSSCFKVYKDVVPEYSDHVQQLCSGLVVALEVRAESAVQVFRQTAGPWDTGKW